MKYRFTNVALFGALCLVCTQVGHTRLLENWPYEKLIKNSDLVVIAETVRIEPTKDTLSVPGWKEIDWAGRNTVFKVKSVIKGKAEKDQVTVLHFRINRVRGVLLINGPLLANFKEKQEYLLFLRKRQDGRFELVSGQIDPVLAVRKISLPLHMIFDEK